jgi:hypothetical protein
MHVQAMGWTACAMVAFIRDQLAPAMSAAGYDHVKLLALDDMRLYVEPYLETVGLERCARVHTVSYSPTHS